MNREVAEIWSDAIGAAGTVIRYGHWGRPVLAFPSEQGRAWDFENNGMVGAMAALLDAGRLKVYCVDSYDAASWSNQEISVEERARQHERYESWILGDILPWIYQDCRGAVDVMTLGCSLGERGTATYFNNPLDYVSHLRGDHLDWLRRHVSLLLVCGQGQWEDTTGSLESTRRLAGLLTEKQISHELDLWGHNVPHDWPSWRAQVAHHMPRFC